MNLNQKVQQIKDKKLKAVENVRQFLEKITDKKIKELNIFLSLNENAIDEATEVDKKIKEGKPVGKLAGLCFAVKSNISVKGLETNCGSKVLEGYISGYNATIINKLKAEDAIILGMLNMDEFACGGSGETSAFGPCKNPINPELIPGGSSSGSAAAIAAKICDFSIGSDTGGSIRNPASHCGVVGLKPTYGAVSRYGLIDMAMSTDTIGPLTKNVKDAEMIFNIIKGQDELDTTTKNFEEIKNKNKYTLGIVNVTEFANLEINHLIKTKTEKLIKENNWKIKEITLPLDIAIETYYILIYTEFFSGTRKFDGRRFGKKIEEAGGPEVIRRIIGGAEICQAEYAGRYYREALKAKKFIQDRFEQLFSEVDVIILPTVPRTPHKIGEEISVKEMYAYDVFTTPASIAGIPGISIPCGEIDNKKVGIQLLAPKGYESWLFDIGSKIE